MSAETIIDVYFNTRFIIDSFIMLRFTMQRYIETELALLPILRQLLPFSPNVATPVAA